MPDNTSSHFVDDSLAGQAFLVTGASSGIGKACAVQLASYGARVVLTGRDETRLAETLSLLAGDGHKVEPIDLATATDLPQWVKSISASVGPLGGLVHSAGLAATVPLRAIQESSIDTIMKVNVNAAIMLAKGFRQKGVNTQPGSIVILSSVMGLVGEPGRIVYSASKAALVGMVRSMGVELAREGIRVNAVAPGVVKTEMTQTYLDALNDEQRALVTGKHPLGLGEPEDIANAVCFLLSTRSRWITGTTLTVDGGYSAW